MKYLFFIVVALSGAFVSCKGGGSKPKTEVTGDTTYVLEPALVVSKSAWEAYSTSGGADASFDVNNLIKEFNTTFPGAESFVLDVSTKVVYVKASGVTFSFDTPPYMYMVTVEGKVAPITSVAESKEMLSDYLVNRAVK